MSHTQGRTSQTRVIVPAPNVARNPEHQPARLCGESFPAIIITERSTRPSADRKRSRSISRVVQRVTGASGGQGPPVQMRRRMLGDPNPAAYMPRSDDTAPTHG